MKVIDGIRISKSMETLLLRTLKENEVFAFNGHEWDDLEYMRCELSWLDEEISLYTLTATGRAIAEKLKARQP